MLLCSPGLQRRLKAAALHWLVSLFVVLAAAVIVFVSWYPYPFYLLAGGTELFWLLVTVDLIMGPLLTLVVFNYAKPQQVLRRDILVIVVLQLAALAYGLHALYLARPVYLVHEVERIQVVTAADIKGADLRGANAEFQTFPVHGIRLVGVRSARDDAEALESIELALAGRDVAFRPHWWMPLQEAHLSSMRERSVPWSLIRSKSTPIEIQQLNSLLTESGLSEAEVMALPLVSRHLVWTIVLRRQDASIVGYLPVDPF